MRKTFDIRLLYTAFTISICSTRWYLRRKQLKLRMLVSFFTIAPGFLLTTQAQVVNLTYNNGDSISTDLSVSAGSSVNLQVASGSASHSGVLSETGGTSTWEKTGAGTLVLSAANTYTGNTTVTEGILNVAGSIASTVTTVETGAGLTVDGASLLDSAKINFNGTGNLTLMGDEAIGTLDGRSSDSTISLGSNNLNLKGNAGSYSYFYGGISGTGGLTVDSSTGGYLIMTGQNTYTGTTTVNLGGLSLSGGQTIADTSAVIVNAGGALDIVGSETIGSLSGTGGVTYIRGGQTLTTNGNTGSNVYAGTLIGFGAGTHTFTKGGSDTLTLLGKLGSSGWNLELNVDSGTLNLSNNSNSITSINVGSGTLGLGANGAAGGASGLITTTGSIIDYANGVNNPTAINVNSDTTQLQVTTGSATQSGVISETSGPRPLEKIGDGSLILSATNTYTGDTTVTGGILNVTGSIASTSVSVETGAGLTVDGASLLDTAALTLNGTGNLTLTGSETIGSLESTSTTSTVILGSNSLTTGDANNTEFAGIMSGIGGINKTGSGTFELSGANTYTGDTTVTGGILDVTGSIASSSITVETGAGLQVDGSSLLDTAGVTLNGTGNLTLTGDETIGLIKSSYTDSTISLGNSTLTVGDSDSTVFFGSISGAGGLTKDGSGSLLLYNTHTYTGATTVNDGTLYLINGTTLVDTAEVVVNGGTLAVDGSETIGALSGTGGRVNIFENQILTTNGTGGATEYSGNFLGNGLSVGEFVKGGTDTLTLSGEIWSTLAKVSVNSGTLILTNDNNAMGAIDVNGGTLRLEAGGAAGGASGLITTTGSVIDYADGVNNPTAINVNSNTTQLQVTTGSANQSGVISETSGPRPIEKIGDGTLVLSAANTYTGGTTVTGGILDVTGSIASTAITVETGAGLQVDGSSLLDSARLTLNGTGNLSLSGDEAIGTLDSASSSSTVSLGSSNLKVMGNSGLSSYFDGSISGTGGLTVDSSSLGYLNLRGHNTYTGTTTVNAGGLYLDGGQAIVDTSAVMVNGGAALQIGASETIGSLSGTGGVIYIGSGQTLTTNGNNGPTEYSGLVYGLGTGPNTFTKAGSDSLTLSGTVGFAGWNLELNVDNGTLILSNNTNEITSIDVNSGTLRLEADGAAGGASGLITTTGSIIDYADGVNNPTAINVNSNTTQLQVTTGSANQSGVISETSGPRPLEKIGDGTLVLSAANTYTGDTTVTGGILDVTGSIASTAVIVETGAGITVDGASLLDTAALTLNGTGNLSLTGSETIGSLESASTTSTVILGNSSTLTTGDANNTEFAGVMSGTGALNKTGSGTFELSGANTYTGDTTVTGGILDVTGSIASSSITVETGAGLQVDGSSLLDTSELTINGTGNLTLTGDETIGILKNSSLTSTINLGSNTLILDVNGSNFSSFYGSISGMGGLTINSNSWLDLFFGNNTYTGATNMNGGVIRLLGGQSIADTSAVIVNDGQFGVGESETIGAFSGNGGRILISQNQTLTTNGNGGPTEYAGSIDRWSASSDPTNGEEFTKGGSDTLTLSGKIGASGYGHPGWGGGIAAVNVNSGTLILSNNDNHINAINLNGGTLRLEADGAAGGASGLITTKGSVIDYADGVNNPTAINIHSNSTQLQVSTGSAEQSGIISETSGPRPLEKIGDGTLILSAANTYTGNTTVTSGILDVTGSIVSTAVTVENGAGLIVDGASLLDTAAVTLNGSGNLTLTGNETIGFILGSATSTVDLGNNTLTAGDSNFSSIGGVISGTGGLTKSGTGQISLSGTNTYTGTTTITNGLLYTHGGQAIFDTAAVVVNAGYLAVEHSETIGALSGTGGWVYMFDNQTLTTNGNAGPTEFSGTVFGEGTNSVFTKDGSDRLTLSGWVGSGLDEVNVNGGTLVLSYNSNNMDAINVNGATLRLEADGAAGGASGLIRTTGSIIDYADGVNIATAINVNSDTTQLKVTTGSGEQSGIISEVGGPRPLEKIGDGTLILSAVNTYTGNTTVTGGILDIRGSIASSAVSVASGAGLLIDGSSLLDTVALTVNGDLTTSENLIIASLAGSSAASTIHLGSNTLTTGSDNISTNYAGSISGSGGLTKTGNGTMSLTGVNSYRGNTMVSGGTLAVMGSGSLASTDLEIMSGSVLSTDGGALTSSATIVNAGSLIFTDSEDIGSINGVGSILFNNGILALNSGNSVLSGMLSGTGGLTVQGTSNTGLSAANTYTGDTLVDSAGILTITSTGSILSYTTVADGGTFVNNGSAGNVSNAGTSSNFGTIATLINTAGVFENDGTISGDASVLGGTLNNNTGASIFGTLTIGSAGVFNNYGSIAAINNMGRFTSTGNIGAVTNSGTFTNSGSIASLINTSGTFNNNGTISGSTTINGGTFNNLQGGNIFGTTFVSSNGTLFNAGQVGEVSNAGSFTNSGIAGSVFNSGTSSNSGTMASFTQTAGSFMNSGQITGDLGIAAGTVSNQEGGNVGGLTIITAPASLDNAGTLANVNNTGTFSNSGTAASVYSTGAFTNTGTVAEVTYAGPAADALFAPQSLSISSTSPSETVAQKFLNAGTVLGNLFLSSGTAEITAQGSVQAVTVVKQGARLSNEGTLGETQNEGTLTSTGTLGKVFNSGTAVNSGNISSLANTAGTFIHNSGTISGNLIVTGGVVDVFAGTVDGVTQNDGGTLNIAGGNFSGDVTNFQGSTTLTGSVQGNFFNNDLMIVSNSGELMLDGSITNYSVATLELAGTNATITSGLTNFGIANAADATLHTDVINAGQFDLTEGTVNGTFDNSGVLTIEDATITGALSNSFAVIAHDTTSIGGLVSSDNGFITMAGNGTGDVLTITGAIPNGAVFETDLDLISGNADHIDAGDSNVSGTVQFVFDTEGTGFIGDPIHILAAGSSDFTLLYSNLPMGGLVDYSLAKSSAGGVDLISQTNMGVGGIAASTSLIQSHVSTVVNRPLSDFLRYQNAQGVAFQSGFARSTYGSATISSSFNNGVSDQEAAFDLNYTGVQAGWDMVYNDARFFNGWNGSIGAMIGHTNGKSDQLVIGTIGNGEFHLASTTHTDFEQNYFTVYGSLNKNRWMWDAQVRMESTEFTLSEKINFGSGLGLNDTNLDNQTLSLSNRISYLWQFANNYELQPSVGISYAQTSAGDVSFTDAQTLQVESYNSMLGFVGGVISRKFTNQSQDGTITLFAEGNYFKDFTSDRSSFFTDMNGGNHAITTGKIEGFGELGIGVSFFRSRREKNTRVKSINGVLRADAQFGDQLQEAISFSGQFRLTF